MSHTTLDLDDSLGALADALFGARGIIEAQLHRIVPHVDVGDLDRYLPLREEAELGSDERDALLRGINEVTGVVLRPEALDGDTSLDDLAHALAVGTLINQWQVTITFASQEGFGTSPRPCSPQGSISCARAARLTRTRPIRTSSTSATRSPPPVPWPNFPSSS
jgi:hypothetical protein